MNIHAANDSLRPNLDERVERAADALAASQRSDGHFVFELEADATVPAEYVLLRHFRGEAVDSKLESKIGRYLRRIQGAHGGWPLFHQGALDISASVKAYFALKMIGDDVDAPHMRRARDAIRAHGGAERSNVFTRTLLALYSVIPWRAVPVMPVEISLLPQWFPFHLSKISYWARTVLVPLLVVMAFKPKAVNARRVSIDELFLQAPQSLGQTPKAPHQKWHWFLFFRVVDIFLRAVEPYLPKRTRQRAVKRAEAFVIERLNGEDGLGAIFPAMANAVLMFDVLGYPKDHPHLVIARQSIEKLLFLKDDEAYCQPCLSPVWDTSLACHALLEAGGAARLASVSKALDWLRPRQILDVDGDWSAFRPKLRPGGWAFQYANPHYPDVDDTAVVVMALDRYRKTIDPALTKTADTKVVARGREWIEGMQSRDGGWGAFDAENSFEYLNHIPFSDHGALLDPSTADVSARCLSMLAQLGETPDRNDVAARARDYLLHGQESEGSWFGRWGMNYIYGTWSALCALDAAGLDRSHPAMRRAADWLIAIQNDDGGWGEDGTSYKLDYRGYERAPSTASQTSWALLGLMAAGRTDHPAVERGIAYLSRTQQADGLWTEERFTATGFPRAFYLRYHGYARIFPLWAMARYRNLTKTNSRLVPSGM